MHRGSSDKEGERSEPLAPRSEAVQTRYKSIQDARSASRMREAHPKFYKRIQTRSEMLFGVKPTLPVRREGLDPPLPTITPYVVRT